MKEIYVYNCPYVKQVAEETIWDFSTSEIYRFNMGGMASKSTRQRLAGTYRVITADNTAMSIELREDKALVVHTDKGPCEGQRAKIILFPTAPVLPLPTVSV